MGASECRNILPLSLFGVRKVAFYSTIERLLENLFEAQEAYRLPQISNSSLTISAARFGIAPSELPQKYTQGSSAICI